MSLAISAMGVAEIRLLPSVPFRERKSFPSTKGVYFVLDGDEVVYIGMTGETFAKRWKTHHRSKDIETSCNSPEIFFLSLDIAGEELFGVEKAFIREHSPRLNGSTCSAAKKDPSESDNDNHRYSITLPRSQVDGYWRRSGMRESAWMKLPQSTRVQVAWTDMMAKIDQANIAVQKAHDSRNNSIN
jgi:hypothetical protein